MVMLLKKRRFRKILYLLPIICLALVHTACIQTSFSTEAIYVEELVTSDTLDESGRPTTSVEVFHPASERVYCFAKIPALSGEKLQAQWYYEDAIIGTVENSVSSEGEVSWFLTQPTDRPTFPEGQYRCEVIYGDVELRSISFEVKE